MAGQALASVDDVGHVLTGKLTAVIFAEDGQVHRLEARDYLNRGSVSLAVNAMAIGAMINRNRLIIITNAAAMSH